METTKVTVPIHDISSKVDEILKKLVAVKKDAVDPAAVQKTIEQIRAIQSSLSEIECCGASCPFEVVNQTQLRIAV